MWTELKRIVDTASLDGRVRCVVLSSTSDRIFTAGLDCMFSTLNRLACLAGSLILRRDGGS